MMLQTRFSPKLYIPSPVLHWVPGITTIVFFLFSVVLWQEVRGRELKLIEAKINEEMTLLKRTIYDNVNLSVIALRRMGERWETSGGTPEKEWRADAVQYVKDFAALTTVEWVDNSYHVRLIEPMKGNEKALGLNIVFDSKRRQALAGAAKAHTITLTPPLDLVQGYRAFIAYIPVHTGGKFDGFIVGVYDTNITLQSLISSKFLERFGIQIFDGDQQVYSKNLNVSRNETDFISTQKLQLFNRTWQISIWPNKTFIREHMSALPEIVLFGGGCISLLAGLAIHYALIAYRRNQLLTEKSVALADSEALYRSVVEAVDGLIIINKDGVVEKFNPAIERIFGYKAQEVVGKQVTNLIPSLQPTSDNGYSDVCFEVEACRKDGSPFVADVTVATVDLSARKIFNIIVRDITVLAQAERERDQLIEKLTESNTQLEQFAYVASHDMQEPLRMIVTFSEILQEELGRKLDSGNKEYLNMVIGAGHRMQGIIADLLEYSRLGNNAVTEGIVDANAEIVHVKNNLNELIKGRDAVLTYGKLPQFKGNSIQFMRLLQNLVTNAIKYQPKDRQPKVHVDVADEGSHWKFSVQDNGLGIDERFTKQVFVPFKRLHSWEQISGTGLGLSICKKIVENHGGTIWVTSTPGEGSTFYFTIAKRGQQAA